MSMHVHIGDLSSFVPLCMISSNMHCIMVVISLWQSHDAVPTYTMACVHGPLVTGVN